MFKRVDRLIYRVPQLESAVRYYRDVLGMKLVRQAGNIASFALGDGETELVLHTDPDLPDQETYLLVEDVRELYRRREELKLKFNAPPVQAARGYRAAVKDPFGNVMLLLDRTSEAVGAGGGACGIEDAKVPGALFAGVETKLPTRREALVRIYEKIGRTADDLPYTPHFEALYSAYAGEHGEPKPTRHEVWRQLLNLRKAAKLPKLGEARSRPPEVDDECKSKLREILGTDIGKRDRLPYTERFDTLVDEFNTTLPRRLSPHLVWRLVATLAK
jgi:catechol 2,3-dioxygenase-like lactoylglutathione lyase family enzyme